MVSKTLPTSNTDPPSAFSWYNNAFTQVLLISFICFGAPGMFNTLSSIGAGLPSWDQATASTGNEILTWTFAFFSILAPSVSMKIGIRFGAFVAASGYLIYTIALWNYSQGLPNLQPSESSESSTSRSLFLAASAWLGICAAMLWVTQGTVIMSYPTTANSGSYVAIFWFIFNSGALAGSVWSFAENFSSSAEGVNDGTYFGFMAIMALASFLAMFMSEANNVRREDGTFVELKPAQSVRAEATGILATFTDYKMLLLTPMMLYTNWCYTYQFNILNVTFFNVRTRSYTAAFYWAAQMFGAMILGKVLDKTSWSLRKRATITLGCTVFLGVISWGLCVYLQGNLLPDSEGGYDLTDTKSLFPAAIYTCFGFLDAFVQVWLYWLMINLTNDPATVVRYSGYYKTLQNVGYGISSALNSTSPVSPMVQLLINCGLFLVCLPPSYMALTKLSDTVAPTVDEQKGKGRELGKELVIVEAVAEENIRA